MAAGYRFGGQEVFTLRWKLAGSSQDMHHSTGYTWDLSLCFFLFHLRTTAMKQKTLCGFLLCLSSLFFPPAPFRLLTHYSFLLSFFFKSPTVPQLYQGSRSRLPPCAAYNWSCRTESRLSVGVPLTDRELARAHMNTDWGKTKISTLGVMRERMRDCFSDRLEPHMREREGWHTRVEECEIYSNEHLQFNISPPERVQTSSFRNRASRSTFSEGRCSAAARLSLCLAACACPSRGSCERISSLTIGGRDIKR